MKRSLYVCVWRTLYLFVRTYMNKYIYLFDCDKKMCHDKDY